MYCQNCGKEISKETKFCKFCGHPTQPPTIVAAEETKVATIQTDSLSSKYVQSPWMFLFLNLITFGLYTPYWGWKNWEIIRKVNGEKMQAGMRGFFIVFTCFSLFKTILQYAKKQGYQGSYSHVLLGIGFVFFWLLNNAVSRAENLDALIILILGLICIAAASFILFPVIGAMNYYLSHNNEEGLKEEIKPNYGLAILLAIIFAFYAYVGFTGTTNSDYSDASKTNFVDSCVKSGGNQSYCDCTYNEIKNKYSYEEFVKMDESGNTPNMDEIISTCSSTNAN